MIDLPISSPRQKTLKTRIHCSGIGLHSGRRATLAIGPAAIDAGIVFKRTDAAGQGAVIPARWDRIVDSRLCTTLGDRDGIAIGTVEHLMAAFAGLEIDNATVEVDGPELPIMDGSAEAFVFLIECAGTVEQSATRKRIKVLKRVAVGDEQASASLAPSAAPIFDFTLDYSSRAIGRQEKSLLLDRENFKRELARARTFGFAEEVDFMRRNGLARGGSLDNAVVIDADRVVNREGLRYRDEFVRHKLLDAVGDLYLAGFPIEGAFHGQRSGHSVNARLLQALFADPAAWALVEDQPSLSAWGEPERRQASA